MSTILQNVSTRTTRPRIEALVSAILLATSFIVLKTTLNINPFVYFASVFLIASAAITLYILIRRIPCCSLSLHDLKVLLLLAGSAEVGAPLLMFTGLLFTTVSHASIASTAEMVLTVAITALIVRERLSPRKYIGVGCVIAGVMAVTITEASVNIGDLMIIGSAALFAFDDSYTVKLSEAISSEQVMQVKFLIGGLVFGAIALFTGAPMLAFASVPYIVYMALFPFASSCVLATNAVRSVGASTLTIILSINIPLGAALGVLLLHETTNLFALGAACVSIGLGQYLYGTSR